VNKDELAGKIEELQQQAQQRLQQLAQADSVWSNVQGQIVAYNEMLGQMEDEKEEAPKAPKAKG
jgi:hypothetical protein